MPGPFSAPNGNVSLPNPIVRADAAKKNSLRTGKTAAPKGKAFRKPPTKMTKGLRRHIAVVAKGNKAEAEQQSSLV